MCICFDLSDAHRSAMRQARPPYALKSLAMARLAP